MANSPVVARVPDCPGSVVAVTETSASDDHRRVPVAPPQRDPDIDSDRPLLLVSAVREDRVTAGADGSQAAVGEMLSPLSANPSVVRRPRQHGQHSQSIQTDAKSSKPGNEEEKPKVLPLPWVASYDKVEEAVREYEIQTTSAFLMGVPDRDFGKTFDECKHHHHIHLDSEGFGSALSPRLSLEGVPYIMMGNKHLICHHGKPHSNSARKVKGKHRLCTQASKKVGCPSHIIIRHVMLLPDFKFDTGKMTLHRRRVLSKLIKAKWKEKEVATESRFYIEFPEASSHRNHPLGEAAGVKQPIDKRVNEKMLSLIGDGMRSVPRIEKSIRDFVRNELFGDTVCPPYSNRRFFPTQKDIANRVFKVSSAQVSHTAKLRKGELEGLVGRLKERPGAQDGLVYFRNTPGLRRGPGQGHMREDPEPGYESGLRTDPACPQPAEGLLFVYQSRHQRRLLARYGCTLTILDPAHRSAAYAVPLYFLLVPTNCDCHVAAIIALERASAQGLREALGIVREANPAWNPRQLMVDASEMEMDVVQSLFPDSSVFITDVRRQQAWERWLADPEHGAAQRRHELATAMEAVAVARTQEGHRAALGALEGAWSLPDLEQMRAWFREEWVPNVQRWAHVYRSPEQMLPLIVNNGAELQREAMRYPYITSSNRSPLHRMLDALINDVLPKTWARYVQTNEAWGSLPNSTLPPWLHNRPRPFVDHCRERCALSGQIERPAIARVAPGVFRVPVGDPVGGHAGSESLVDLSLPSCSCDDFSATGYPCAHLMACITDGDGQLQWEQLPSSYVFSPLLTVDDGREVDGPVDRVVDGAQVLADGDSGNDECTAAVTELSHIEESTSSLGAILAAVEAQTLTESTGHPTPSDGGAPMMTDDPTRDDDEASRCQAVARELLALTHTVVDGEALAHARLQMESALATLRQALPRGGLPPCHQQPTDEIIQVHLVETPAGSTYETHPPKRPRRESASSHPADDQTAQQEIEVAIEGEATVEIYEDGRRDPDGNESIVTETIDLQQGAVFFLEPPGLRRNFEIADAIPMGEAIGSVILKDREELNYSRP